MGVAVLASTIRSSVTPVCSSCGVALCYDISIEEYSGHVGYWDSWRCEVCDPDVVWTYAREYHIEDSIDS